MHTTAAASTSRDSRVDELATRLLEERGQHLLQLARRNSATRDDAETRPERIAIQQKGDRDLGDRRMEEGVAEEQKAMACDRT